MKLGEILIKEGRLTQEGLEEALDWQVLYGGRLGTNLLELKLVEEEHLARALGKQLGCEITWGALDAEPELLPLVPKHVADRNEFVPWKLEKRRLKVLSTEPDRLDLIDELSRRTGKIVQLVVAPEFRMFQLLRKHYQATRQMRALDFGVVPVEREAMRRKRDKQVHGGVEAAPELIDEGAFQQIYAQVLEGRSPPVTAGPSAVDAVDFGTAVADSVENPEQAAQPAPAWPSQYGTSAPRDTPLQTARAAATPFPKPAASAPPQRRATDAAAARPFPQRRAADLPAPAPAAAAPASALWRTAPKPAPAAAQPPPAPSVESLPDDAILGDAEILESDPIEAEVVEAVSAEEQGAPAAAAEAPAEAGGAPHDTQESERLQAGDWMHSPDQAAPAAPAAQAAGWDAPEPAPPPAAEEPALDFKEAVKLLEGVTDRDAIARIVLRTARSMARRALLMTVQGQVAIGWDGLGEGLEDNKARTVAVPLTLPSAFQLVVSSRSHFMGPLQKTPINIRFLAQMGKKVPFSSLLLPILHRGRVSHLLYLDNGHKQHAPSDIGDMLILSMRIAQSVEALVQRKRQAAQG